MTDIVMVTRRSVLAAAGLAVGSGTLSGIGCASANGASPSDVAPGDERSTRALERARAAHAKAIAIDSARGTKYLSVFRRVVAGDPKGAEQDVAFEKAWDDPAFIKNFNEVIDRALKGDRLGTTIFNGEPDIDFPDCVAVKTSRSWNASGVLISPRVVLTAAHVYRDQPQSIWVGSEIEKEGKGTAYKLDAKKAKLEPNGHDLAVLVLSEGASVADAQVKQRGNEEQSNAAETVIAVGYGSTSASGQGFAGERRFGLMVKRANPCDAKDNDLLGCVPKIEFVFGGARADSCRGDSGGGCYSEKRLLGITSRGVKGARGQCGLGGIYVRVAEHRRWIDDMIRANS